MPFTSEQAKAAAKRSVATRWPLSFEQRFMSYVEDAPGGCWRWIGNRMRSGYGQLHWQGRTYTAHRAAYMFFVAPVPEGLFVDHLCRNRWCVNPEHLEAVSRGENIRRGYAARGPLTHCHKGHEYTPENTYTDPRGTKRCRICAREYNRQRTDTLGPEDRRSQLTKPDTCPQGHNDWAYNSRNGWRYCAECNRQKSRAARRRQKE